MRTLHGRIVGPLVVSEDTRVHGRIDGDVDVAPNATFFMHGFIVGNLDVAEGARVELRGVVGGSARNRGELIVYGDVRGSVQDAGAGRTRYVRDSGRRPRSVRSPTLRSR